MSRAIARLRRGERTAVLQLVSLGLAIMVSFLGVAAFAQTAVQVPKPEEKDKAERALNKQQEKTAQGTSVIVLSPRSGRVHREKSCARS